MLCKPNDIKLAEEILHSKLADTIPSLKWGHIHENDAFTEYIQQFVGENNTMRKSGLYIGKSSFLGASPDGIIEMDGKCHKIIEIKFPYSFRDSSVEETCSKGGFDCTMGRWYALFEERSSLLLSDLRHYGHCWCCQM